MCLAPSLFGSCLCAILYKQKKNEKTHLSPHKNSIFPFMLLYALFLLPSFPCMLLLRSKNTQRQSSTDRSIDQLCNLRRMIICDVVHCKCLLTCLIKASNDASNNSFKLTILNPIFLKHFLLCLE